MHQARPGVDVCGDGGIGTFQEREMADGVRYDVADFQVRRGRVARPG